jgi:hypothetical protein
MSGGHTPGPWFIDMIPNSKTFGASAGRAYGVSAPNRSGYRVPVVVWRGLAKPASEEGQANARLIAAAPDLLEALIEARQTILDLKNARWSECEGSDADWVGDIDAALAKARQSTPADCDGEGG